jgi:hypothetical protein
MIWRWLCRASVLLREQQCGHGGVGRQRGSVARPFPSTSPPSYPVLGVALRVGASVAPHGWRYGERLEERLQRLKQTIQRGQVATSGRERIVNDISHVLVTPGKDEHAAVRQGRRRRVPPPPVHRGGGRPRVRGPVIERGLVHALAVARCPPTTRRRPSGRKACPEQNRLTLVSFASSG